MIDTKMSTLKKLQIFSLPLSTPEKLNYVDGQCVVGNYVEHCNNV